MLRALKLFFYLVIIVLVIFLYWFLPKYSFVQKNPGYCANLTTHLYYCGSQTDLQDLFKK
jgi:hypothetical protein